MIKHDEKVSKAINQLIDMFKTGNMPEAIASTVIKKQAGYDIPCHNWSLGNQLLVLLAGTTDGRTYMDWKKAGRYVKSNPKTFYILEPCTKKVKDIDEKSGEEEDRYVIYGFKASPRFRYEDTEGKELELPNYNPPELPPLIEVANAYGVKVKYGPFTKRFYGYFRPGEIMLCSHDVHVFFHELSHAVHNAIRTLKGGQDAAQEIVAETCAAALCQIYGYEGFIYDGFKYIQGYAKAEDGAGVVKEIMKVLSDIEKVLNLILSHAAMDHQLVV